MVYQSSCKHRIAASFAFKQKRLLQLSINRAGHLQVAALPLLLIGKKSSGAAAYRYSNKKVAPLYFSMCCPFSAITNRTGDQNPSMALLVTAWGNEIPTLEEWLVSILWCFQIFFCGKHFAPERSKRSNQLN